MQIAYSDQALINGLQHGGAAADEVLRYIYLQNRIVVLDFVKKNNGSLEEAKDIFQEAMMVFYENVQQGKFKGESALASYIYSIARFIWLNRLKRKGIGQKIIETQKASDISESFLPGFLEKEKHKQVLGIFEKLGADCKKVLVLNIYQYFNMQEIAQEMNYDNEQIARNKKYKCLKKLKNMIAEKPGMVDFLINEE